MSEVPLPPELADQLREAHETYRHLVEGIPAVLYVDANDDHSSNIYTSPQIEPLLGFTVEQWRDDPALWVDRMHEDDRERVLGEHRDRSRPATRSGRSTGCSPPTGARSGSTTRPCWSAARTRTRCSGAAS